MRSSIKTLLVVLAAIMSFVCIQTVRAEDTVTGTIEDGKIKETYRDSSKIDIEYINGSDPAVITIIGFPFNNLEAQLDDLLDPPVTIDKGDCVTVDYYEKKDVYKWLSLSKYYHCGEEVSCEACSSDSDIYIGEVTRKPQGSPWDNVPPGWDKPPPGWDGTVPPGWDGTVPPGWDGTVPPGQEDP